MDGGTHYFQEALQSNSREDSLQQEVLAALQDGPKPLLHRHVLAPKSLACGVFPWSNPVPAAKSRQVLLLS